MLAHLSERAPDRWSLLPESATPLPWKRRDAFVRTRIALYLMERGQFGATQRQMRDALDLDRMQVLRGCWELTQERLIVAIGTVPSARRSQGGGKPQTLYAWRTNDPTTKRRLDE
jgi:hypothetical protein